MNKLNITYVVVNPKQICDSLQGFTVYATINGKPLGFRFDSRDHDCNKAFEATVTGYRAQHYDFYEEGEFIQDVAAGGSCHRYALSIPDSVLFSKPKLNQKNFSFTGQYYSTAPIVPYFKKIMNELYESGQLTPAFLEYLGIDNNQESDNIDECKKLQSSNLKRGLKEDSLDDFIPGPVSKKPFINFYFQVRYFNSYGKENRACRELCNGLKNFHSVEDCMSTGRAISAVVENNPEAIRIFFTDLVELCHQNNTRFWYMHFKTQESELAEPISCYCPKIDNDTCESLDVEKLIQAATMYLKESKRRSIKESEVCDNREITPEIVTEIINSSPCLQAENTDYRINIYAACNHTETYLAAFCLDSAESGKITFQVPDVDDGTDSKSYLNAFNSPDPYDSLTIQLLDNLYNSTHNELNNWEDTQDGNWIFEVKSLDDVAWYVEQIEEAVQTVEDDVEKR